MTKDDIIRTAREAGAYRLVEANKGSMICISQAQLERFAALVIANHPPQSSMAWQEGNEAGRLAERESMNNAYKERNQLVALLSMLFPSGKAKTAIDGWDEAWHGCVYIDFPWGQASWHYHTDDEQMFAHLPPYTKPWDGHTTEAKYAAIAAAIRARGQA